jgi:xanthine dehydrogenase accessory factor
MEAIYRKIVESAKGNRPAVLATIIRQAGSAPRRTGAKCLIKEDGSLEGTIGGGLLEAQTVEKAKSVFETRLPSRLGFRLKGADVAETEMLCGGEVDVFLEPVLPDVESCLAISQKVLDVFRRGGAGVVATVLTEGSWETGPPPKMFVDKGGKRTGSLLRDSAIEESVLKRVAETLRSNHPEIASFEQEAGGPIEVYLEPVVSDPVLFIFGGGHVSRDIVPLASRVGFHVVVIDDRQEFADPKDFPGAREVHQLPFEGVMGKLSVSDSSYLVIVTRGHLYDKEVIEQSLRTRAKYIGMIGSRRKRNMIYERLLEEGFTKEDLSRVHSPIGIDIGAETPAEIAVSIVGELIKVRAGGQ